uniref:DDE_Tnp_ISL3 domain-containing protein n=1 Tax=Caenorhabditis tropicalis TaxID=1561998 RepID=A0A1I7TJK2_9PELO
MDYLTTAQENRIKFAVYRQIAYDRRQAAYMIDAMMDQLQNSHLTVDYKIQLSRRVIAARRKWFREFFLDLESYELLDLMRLSCRIYSWGKQLSDLFTTNARMIRDRMSRIRELNFHRRNLQLIS